MLRSRAAGMAFAVLAVASVSTAALPAPCAAQTPAVPPPAPSPAAVAPAPLAAPSATRAGRPRLPEDTATRVVAAVRAVSPGARVGLLVWDVDGGAVLASSNPSARHQSASLVKLLVAVQARREGVDPARIGRMLRESDDAVASALWGELGGDALPGRVAASIGVAGVTGPDIPGRWGNTLLSAEDLLATYRHLITDAPDLLTPLLDAPRTAADGFDQHFGIPAAVERPWSIKQAWGTSAQATTAHSTGLLGDSTLVLLLTSHPPGTGFRQAASAVTAGARTLADVL